MRRMRSWSGARLIGAVTVLVASATLGAVASAAPGSAAAPYCGITWGSLAKQHASTKTAPLTNIRGGQHECYDRLVFDFAGDVDGYYVRYVSQVTEDGSGNVVPVRGGAKLQIVVVGPAYDPETGKATYRPANRKELVNVSGWQTFRQVAWAGSFEGQTTVGLGVRARLPFRVFTLDGPGNGSRIVVDVAHRW